MQHSKMKKYLIILILLFIPVVSQATVFSSSGGVSNITSGLIGWWKFDNGSGPIIDSSGSGFNTSPTANVSYTIGKIGPSALNFSGGNADFGNILNQTTGSFSVTCWIRYSANQIFPIVIGKSGSNGYRINITSGEAVYWQINDGTGENDAGFLNLQDGQWHFLAGVVDRTAAISHLYIDTVDSNPSSIAGYGSLTSPNDFVMGPAGASSYIGDLDDCREYNRALSQAEVNQLYLYIGVATFQKLLVQIGHTLIVKR